MGVPVLIHHSPSPMNGNQAEMVDCARAVQMSSNDVAIKYENMFGVPAEYRGIDSKNVML